MRMPIGADLGSLSFVREEIDRALSTVIDKLGTDLDAATAGSLVEELHRIAGAVRMAGLEGLIRYAEALESVAAALRPESGTNRSRGDLSKALADGTRALKSYMDQIAAGHFDRPLRLLPAYAALRLALGEDKVPASDLFWPDISQPRPADSLLESEPDLDPRLTVRATRSRYQRGMLAWLKGDKRGLPYMGDAITAMDRLYGRVTPLFWACIGFFEAIIAGGIEADSQIKRLCARIDIQLARMGDGSESVAEGLLRDVLYHVATSKTVSATVARLREHYALAEYMRESSADARDASDTLDVLKRLRLLWEQCVTSEMTDLRGMRSLLAHLHDDGDEEMRSVIHTLTDAFDRLAADADAKTPAETGVAVAKLLLVAEDYLNVPPRARRTASDRLTRATDQLRGALNGTKLTDAMTAFTASGTELSPEALLPVCTEVIASIKRIEHSITTYAAQPAQPAEAEKAVTLLAQLAATLHVAQLENPARVARHCRDIVNAWIEHSASSINDSLPDIAEALAAIEITMQALRTNQSNAATVLDSVMDRLGIPRIATAIMTPAPDPAPQSVEQELQRERKETQTIFNEWRDLYSGTLEKLQRNLRTVHEDARLTADREVENSSAAALAVVHKLHTEATADLAPIINAMRPDNVDSTSAGAAQFDVGSDPEILEVFLEEATEVLQAIADNLGLLREFPQGLEPFVVIRRSFHTLKGSSRMAGLSHMGDVAWRYEELLNLWLADNKTPTAELLDALDATRVRFSEWIQTLKQGSSVAINAEDLLQHVARIRGLNDEPTPTAAANASTLTAAPPAPEKVTLGDAITVSKTLYEIFLHEAASHIAAMREQFMRTDLAPVAHASVRAAHTLAGIARTVGVGSMAELSYALEQLLQLRQEAESQLSATECLLVAATLDSLTSMLGSVSQRHLPEPDEALIAELHAVRQPASPPDADEALPQNSPISLATTIDPADLATIDPELRTTFAEEAFELASALARATHAWRTEPDASRHADEVARHLHTLKGSARSAGAMNVGELVHDMESRVLAAVQADSVDRGLLDGLQHAFDQWCEVFEGARHNTQTGISAAAVAAAASDAADDGAAGERQIDDARPGLGGSAQLRVHVQALERLLDASAEFALSRMRIDSELSSARHGAGDINERVGHLRNQLREIEIQAESQMHARFDGMDRANADFDPLEFDRYTRLQELTRLMAESLHDLTTVQHNLARHFDQAGAILSHQARVQRVLQADLMHIRTTAFNSITERLQRIARRTAAELNREVELHISGGQVELDRTLLEKLQAPLEHMIRNAIAHGIESRQERSNAGKPAVGSIHLTIRQEANATVLLMSDDGSGLDLARIRRRAESIGLLGPQDSIDDDSLRQFIFRAGFSTADQITEVAGRGVGLDIVHNAVMAMGGGIKVDSHPGKGTTFSLSVPLTLAVTQAVIVHNAGQTYGIPSTLISKVERCNEEQLLTMYDQRATEMAGERYPFRYLGELLGTAPHGTMHRRNNIVILLRAGDERLALHVDDLLANQELALKEMGVQLGALPGIAGATVGTDGHALLILNPVQIAGRQTTHRPRPRIVETRTTSTATLVLVVDDSVTVRKVTSRLLERSGYRVVTAKDGVEALERIREEVPAAILMDIEMPRMDGFELTKHIRSETNTNATPIIMISSRTAEKHRVRAMELGVNVFLGKPFNDEMLLRHMERLINPEPIQRSVA